MDQTIYTGHHKNYEIGIGAKALYSGVPLNRDTLAPEKDVYLGPTKYAE